MAGPWRMRGYVVEHVLGAGGSSSVWRARVAATGEAVALKRLTLGSTEQVARATAEAAKLRVLDHPHLVRLHDFVLDGHSAVLVLDLADGGTLADLLAVRGRLTVGEAITAIAPVAAALAHTHAAGVVHGDVSTANILFTRDGLPLLADLGVARLTGDEADAESTPAYVDPLVARGGIPTPQSDIFMLGAVALHTLTGLPLWTANSADAALQAAREAGRDGRLDQLDLRLAAADLPDAVTAVLRRALQLEPFRRGTAADFALDLRHSGRPVAVELSAGRPRRATAAEPGSLPGTVPGPPPGSVPGPPRGPSSRAVPTRPDATVPPPASETRPRLGPPSQLPVAGSLDAGFGGVAGGGVGGGGGDASRPRGGRHAAVPPPPRRPPRSGSGGRLGAWAGRRTGAGDDGSRWRRAGADPAESAAERARRVIDASRRPDPAEVPPTEVPPTYVPPTDVSRPDVSRPAFDRPDVSRPAFERPLSQPPVSQPPVSDQAVFDQSAPDRSGELIGRPAPTNAIVRARPVLPVPRRGPTPRLVGVVCGVLVVLGAIVLGGVLWNGARNEPAAARPPVRAAVTPTPSASTTSPATTANRASRRVRTPSVAPTSAARPVPVPTSHEPDWAESLRGLDAVRARAFATRDIALLRRVYVTGPLRSADTATLVRAVPAGCGLLGVRTHYAVLSTHPGLHGSAVITAEASLPATHLVCAGTTSGDAAPLAVTRVRVTLVRVGAALRIGREQVLR